MVEDWERKAISCVVVDVVMFSCDAKDDDDARR